MLAQDTLKQDPSSGNLFVFRGKRGGLVKFLTGDGQGFAETGGLLSYHAGSPGYWVLVASGKNEAGGPL